MGGKGGGQGTNTVTTSTIELSEYQKPYYEQLMNYAQQALTQPYQTYTGARIADSSPTQNAANQGMIDLALSGQGAGLTEAQRLAYNVGNTSMGDVNNNISSGYNAGSMIDPYTGKLIGGYDASSRNVGYAPGQLNDSQMLNSYMSPYMQQVVDVQKREAMRDADIRHQQTGLGAAQAGSLGGYREALMRSETERDLGQRLGDIQSQGQQASFADAKQSFEADRGARAKLEQFGQSQFGMNQQIRQAAEGLMLQGYSAEEATRQAQEQFGQSQFGMNTANQQFSSQQQMAQYQAYESARQQAAQMGLSAQQANQAGQLAVNNQITEWNQNRLGAASQLADYDQQSWQGALEKLGIISGVGQGEQANVQAGLDTAYSDWLRQQANPYEQINFFSNMLQGTGMTPGQTTSMFGAQPSGTQAGIGSLIAALGAGKGGSTGP